MLVTEPTPSGVHDLERAVELCAHFDRRAGIIINKAGLDPAREADIAALAASRGVAVLAEIPYDRAVIDVLVSGRTMADLGEHAVGRAVRAAWSNVLAAAKRAVL